MSDSMILQRYMVFQEAALAAKHEIFGTIQGRASPSRTLPRLGRLGEEWEHPARLGGFLHGHRRGRRRLRSGQSRCPLRRRGGTECST